MKQSCAIRQEDTKAGHISAVLIVLFGFSKVFAIFKRKIEKNRTT